MVVTHIDDSSTDATRVPASHRTQEIELSSLLAHQSGTTAPPKPLRDAKEIDVLRLADTRIHQLLDERQQLRESLRQSKATLELLRQRASTLLYSQSLH